jgi:hypothetical protein
MTLRTSVMDHMTHQHNCGPPPKQATNSASLRELLLSALHDLTGQVLSRSAQPFVIAGDG